MGRDLRRLPGDELRLQARRCVIAFLLLGVLGILIFDAIWMQVGLGAAIVVVCGGLLLFAWMTDRKDRAARAGYDELPPV